MFGGKALATLTWSSFFPNNKNYSFITTSNLKNTYEYVEILKKIQNKGKVIRVLITETDINMNFLIESFTYQEQDGSGDVYYTLNLKEYRTPKVYYSDTSNFTSNTSSTVTTRSTPAATTNKTYIVKRGDTLWGIAQRNYGDGSKYTKIFEANKDKIKNPNVITKGMELIIP